MLWGTSSLIRILYGLFTPKVRIIGCDIAGRVEAVGGDVEAFQPGDEVFGDLSMSGFGAFAVCLRADSSLAREATDDLRQAAAILAGIMVE
jgi:NADPH:quinone reductase-like Zn-dependent oxidoreductase